MSKGDQTREQIVERALALAGEVGMEGLSLGVLAAGLNLSKSGLFAHFKSKEALQLEVLQRAIDHFIEEVVLPALKVPRGEPRVRVLFDHYLLWIHGHANQGSCFFMALTHEYDDRPGPIRDLLVRSQRDWYDAAARTARTAVEEGHFAADTDTEQFGFEMVGIGMVYQQSAKLLGDPKAEERARQAFESLLRRYRSDRSDRAVPAVATLSHSAA